MTNLCGHDSALLQWACAQSAPMLAVWSTNAELAESERERAVLAVCDPAKLAEMLAARGRELGLDFWHGPNEPREPSPTDYVLYVIDGVIRLYSPLSPKAWQRHYTIAQARVILLQWLQLPDGAQEEAGRALRGET